MDGTLTNHGRASIGGLTPLPSGGESDPMAVWLSDVNRSRYGPWKIHMEEEGCGFQLSHANGDNALQSRRATVCCGKNCLCCSFVDQSGIVKSTTMKRKYVPLIAEGSQINCCTHNVVYVISCQRCGMQYVGQTGRKL